MLGWLPVFLLVCIPIAIFVFAGPGMFFFLLGLGVLMAAILTGQFVRLMGLCMMLLILKLFF